MVRLRTDVRDLRTDPDDREPVHLFRRPFRVMHELAEVNLAPQREATEGDVSVPRGKATKYPLGAITTSFETPCVPGDRGGLPW